jgi:hypothetical protein
MLKIKKQKMLHMYKLAQKLKIKKRKGENQTGFESIIIFFSFSFFLYFSVVDINGPACCILACIVIVPVLL